MLTYNYFSQLEYAFNNYWTNYGEITTTNLILPCCNVDTSGHPSSVFNLLFNNVYSESTYEYKFILVENTFLPKSVKERLNFSYNNISIYLSDNTSEALNVMYFTDEEVDMFDLLLVYRKGSTPDLSTITFSNLNSNLSKFIYAYLQLVVNYNFDYINSSTSSSDPLNLLEILYELYLVNESHQLIRSWTFVANNELVYLRPWRQTNEITISDTTTGYICLDYTPYNTNNLVLYRNGNIQDPETYEIHIIDSTGCLAVDWRERSLTVDFEDVLLSDYRLEVTE